MIDLTEDKLIYRVLGVDNGTDTVGIAVVDHHLATGLSKVIHAETLTASRTAYTRHEGRLDARGKMHARLDVISTFFWEVLNEFDPDVVGCESPFQHLHAQSFAALTTAMNGLSSTTFDYCTTLEFSKISPGSAKKAVCPVGQYGNSKEHIREMIGINNDIEFVDGLLLNNLDEHAVDAIAVAHAVGTHASLNAFWYKDGKMEKFALDHVQLGFRVRW